MKTFLRLAVAALLLVAFASPAFADSRSTPRVSNMTVAQFLRFHDDVSAKLGRKPYAHVTSVQRQKVAAAQADIRKLLDDKASMKDLDESERVVLFNAHEQVVGVMNDAELDKLVCKREKKMGSHLGELVCRTQRQIQAQKDATATTRLRRKAAYD